MHTETKIEQLITENSLELQQKISRLTDAAIKINGIIFDLNERIATLEAYLTK